MGDTRIPVFDTTQNIKNVSAYDDGTTTTISFIRPRVSDHFQDIGLDQCVFVIWAFGGFVLNHATPASFSRHTDRGVFGTQLCLQECAPPPPG